MDTPTVVGLRLEAVVGEKRGAPNVPLSPKRQRKAELPDREVLEAVLNVVNVHRDLAGLKMVTADLNKIGEDTASRLSVLIAYLPESLLYPGSEWTPTKLAEHIATNVIPNIKKHAAERLSRTELREDVVVAQALAVQEIVWPLVAAQTVLREFVSRQSE